MPRIEVAWTGVDEDGGKRQVCARTRGDRWLFFERSARFDDWQPVPSPSLEDWLALLDGVRRRGGRHLARRDDVKRLETEIRRHYPDADVGGKR